jgi:hypothetical protein
MTSEPSIQSHSSRLLYFVLMSGLASTLAAESPLPTSSEILARVEVENTRRHIALKVFSGSRQYTLQNIRFGKQATVAVLINYRQVDTVVARSGSDRLNGIIDRVLSSEAGVSLPAENARHDITSANHRVRLLRVEVAAGRNCYVLDLAPRIRSRFLIVGKVWIDSGSYSVVRIDGQFAASLSVLVGAPQFTEEFVEVHGFWMPEHVHSVSSGLLLGSTELDVLFSNYQFD